MNNGKDEYMPDVGPSTLTTLQRQAILVGLHDGRHARRDAGLFGFLRLFTRLAPTPLADKRLEALRAWAELAVAIDATSSHFPVESLEEAGLAPGQIVAARKFLQAELSTSEVKA